MSLVSVALAGFFWIKKGVLSVVTFGEKQTVCVKSSIIIIIVRLDITLLK